MKNASEIARRVRRLVNQAKAGASAVEKVDPPTDDVTDHVLLAVLMRYAADSAAAPALRRLRERTVDLNELRVTPVAELIDLLGPAFPQSKVAAESVARVLGAIFNRCHHLDLGFLHKMGRREARTYLETLDGMDPFAAAVVVLRALKHHAVPVDERVLAWFREEGAVPAEAAQSDVQGLLERIVGPAQADAVFVGLRKKVATRPSRAAAPRSSGDRAARREKSASAKSTPAKQQAKAAARSIAKERTSRSKSSRAASRQQ